MSPLRDRVAALALSGPTRVAVVAPDEVDLAALQAELPPGSTVLRLAAARAAALHEALAAHDHQDVVVDLARGPGVADRLPVLLAHLTPGGRLLVALPHRELLRAPLLALLDDVRRVQAAGAVAPARRSDDRPEPERDLHALAAAITDLVVDEHHVGLRMGVELWSKVPEHRFDAFLGSAPAVGRVVAHRDAAAWTASAPFASSDPDERGIDTVSAPALSLREYDDAVVTARLVSRVGDVVLPQTFRNTALRRPRTPTLTDWSPWSVRVPTELGRHAPPPTPLPGTWFHADTILPGHFGHALTEQLSVLWAWPEVLERHPDAGVLITAVDRTVGAWEPALLEAAGVPRDRLHAAPGPVRVERLLAATNGYVIQRHLHPVVRDVHQAVGDALEARAGAGPRPERLFLTRRGPKRGCRNAAEVEALFVRHGFSVVAPEEHPLADQVAMVRAARAVGGYGGSGLFHLALGCSPRPVVVVSSTTYPVWNEKMMTAAWGHPLTVVRGTPDVVTRRVGSAAFHASYTVDLDREGRLLAETLEGLV